MDNKPDHELKYSQLKKAIKALKEGFNDLADSEHRTRLGDCIKDLEALETRMNSTVGTLQRLLRLKPAKEDVKSMGELLNEGRRYKKGATGYLHDFDDMNETAGKLLVVGKGHKRSASEATGTAHNPAASGALHSTQGNHYINKPIYTVPTAAEIDAMVIEHNYDNSKRPAPTLMRIPSYTPPRVSLEGPPFQPLSPAPRWGRPAQAEEPTAMEEVSTATVSGAFEEDDNRRSYWSDHYSTHTQSGDYNHSDEGNSVHSITTQPDRFAPENRAQWDKTTPWNLGRTTSAQSRDTFGNRFPDTSRE